MTMGWVIGISITIWFLLSIGGYGSDGLLFRKSTIYDSASEFRTMGVSFLGTGIFLLFFYPYAALVFIALVVFCVERFIYWTKRLNKLEAAEYKREKRRQRHRLQKLKQKQEEVNTVAS